MSIFGGNVKKEIRDDKKETRPYCRIKSSELEIEGYGCPYGSGLEYAEGMAKLFNQLVENIKLMKGELLEKELARKGI